jgi:hypothetical protein
MFEATVDVQKGLSPKPSKESYLPENFNDFLFQGTTSNNSKSIQGQGLLSGSVSSNILSCFSYSDGTFIMSRNNPGLFEPVSFSTTQFEIKKQNVSIKYSSEAHNRDGLGHFSSEEGYSDRHISKENLVSLSINNDQMMFLQLFDKFIHGGLVGPVDIENINSFKDALKASGHEVEKPKDMPNIDYGWGMRYWKGNPEGALHEEIKFIKYLEQKEIAEILDISLADMRDISTLENCLNDLGGEEKMLEKIAAKFPEAAKFNWNNAAISESEVPKILVEQIYKSMLAALTSNKYKGVDSDYGKRVVLEGPSRKGLDELLSAEK